jgi:hypothetical protein
MNLNVAYLPRATTRERAIAPHGSGAGASERCYLAEALGGRYQVLAPEHYGSESSGPWTGEHAFSVADETARTLALIEKCAKSVRLVGRSYGAGLPLHVTLARPEGIASLAAYELAFHLLPQMGEFGVAAYMEITAVARHVCQGVVTGDDHGARRPFVDYWSGPGAFDAMHVHVPNSIDPLGVQVPAQLLRSCRRAGGQERLACLKAPSPHPAWRTCSNSNTDPHNCGGAIGTAPCGSPHGDKGPFTHAPEACRLILQHISANEDGKRFRHWRPRGLTNILGAALQPAKAGS